MNANYCHYIKVSSCYKKYGLHVIRILAKIKIVM